jgi:cell division septation protein DedD
MADDDRYREFHLEGKQLGFLVISAIVIVVVVFLCGVMVGRGVRVPYQDDLVAGRVTLADDPTDAALGGSADDLLPSTSADPQPIDDFSYPALLAGASPVPETLEEPEALPAPPVAPVPAPSPVAAPVLAAPAAAAPVAASALKEPSGNGFAVQVMSLTKLSEAETVARRLASKGYPSFVQPTPDGRFRVRVGKYPDRKDAESVARRLEKEEKFNAPWVDR